MRKLVLLVSLLVLPFAAHTDGFDGDYEAYIGDFNGDGLEDVYIFKRNLVVPISLDDVALLVVRPDIDAFILQQNPDGTFTVVAASPGISTSSLTPADVVLDAIDIDGDGVLDLIISGLFRDIPGSATQFVFATGTKFQPPSAVVEDWADPLNSTDSLMDLLEIEAAEAVCADSVFLTSAGLTEAQCLVDVKNETSLCTKLLHRQAPKATNDSVPGRLDKASFLDLYGDCLQTELTL